MSYIKDQLTKGQYVQLKPKDKRPDAKREVEAYEYYQMYQVKKKKIEMPIIAHSDWSWQSDTLFIPYQGKMRAIYVAVEMTRRLGFVRVYKKLTLSAEESLSFLKELVKTYPVKFYGMDMGREYENKIIKDYLKAHHIEYYYYARGDYKSKSLVESFNKTIRQIVNRYTETIDPNWKDALPKLISDYYNHKVHSRIHKRPADMTDLDVEKYWNRMLVKGQKYLALLHSFHPGDDVRVLIKEDPDKSAKELAVEAAYGKVGALWTRKLYEVDKPDGYRIMLKGYNQRFSPASLQKVNEVESIDLERPMPEKQRREQGKLKREMAVLSAEPQVAPRNKRVSKKKQMEEYEY